jgi:hypothetical protein
VPEIDVTDELIAAIDSWIEQQPEPRPSRGEAVRMIIEQWRGAIPAPWKTTSDGAVDGAADQFKV